MKKYILPVIAFLVFTMYSCEEDSATPETKVENKAKEIKTVAPIKKIENKTPKVNNQIKKVDNIKKVNTQKVANTTSIKVDRMKHDFGTITTDAIVRTKFTITNTGKNPLIITKAKGSCGCTVPEWPREPIAPGESGTINVSFNPKNRSGKNTKSVTITANTEPANTVLTITSVVDIKK